MFVECGYRETLTKSFRYLISNEMCIVVCESIFREVSLRGEFQMHNDIISLSRSS